MGKVVARRPGVDDDAMGVTRDGTAEVHTRDYRKFGEPGQPDQQATLHHSSHYVFAGIHFQLLTPTLYYLELHDYTFPCTCA